MVKTACTLMCTILLLVIAILGFFTMRIAHRADMSEVSEDSGPIRLRIGKLVNATYVSIFAFFASAAVYLIVGMQ